MAIRGSRALPALFLSRMLQISGLSLLVTGGLNLVFLRAIPLGVNGVLWAAGLAQLGVSFVLWQRAQRFSRHGL